MAANESTEERRLDLDPRLIFTRFGELAKVRETLYQDFIEVDEPDEISSAWVNFSASVVNDLLSVIKQTKSLFERLIDELRRSSPQQDGSKEFERIQNLTDFWLDLAVMSYLYSTIQKRGILGQPGSFQNSLGYIETKKSIDDLIILAFQTGQDFFSLQARITLGEVLSLEQDKKRLDFYDTLDNVDEKKFQLLGQYDQLQAGFLMTRVQKRLIQSSATWWWKDPIGMHSSSEHAISHIESMQKHWEKCTSDLQVKGQLFHSATFPIAKISSDVSLAQHYRRLAIAALKVRGTSVSSEYFAKAAELTASLGIENLGIIDRLELWEPSIPEQYLIYDQMRHLTTIASKYQSILHYLKDGKLDEIKVLIPEVLSKISNMLSQGDIAYVSSVAVTYETVFSYILEQISHSAAPDVGPIVKFVEKRIQTVAERLHNASHQITNNWLKVVKKDPNNISAIKEVVSRIDLPLMAIFILPPDAKVVGPASSELLAVQKATEALSVGTAAEKEFGKNPVKEMLMRAKTYQLTHEALSFITDVGDEDTINAIKEVLKPITKDALLRGLIAEVQLRTAVLQYRFINTIAPLVENSSLANPNAKSIAKIDEEELKSFSVDLEELNIASIAIQKHKVPITIGGSPLNWNYITKLENYSTGLIEIVQSIQSAINASIADKDAVEDAVNAWNEAKQLAFKAADLIAKAGAQDSENLAQQVYALAQIYSGYENKRRDRKSTSPFPVAGIVELLQALIMGL
ncbi:MAG: hypothetical protein ACXAD7_06990 [Candidatus Kariarchaeaceae archaeon]|jgi:hypothetical protein